MRRLVQLGGVAAVAALMYVEAGPLNGWLMGLGIYGIHPAVLPAILGFLLLAALKELRALDSLGGLLSVAVGLAAAWLSWVPLNIWLRSSGLPVLHPAALPVLAGLLALVLTQSLVAPFAATMQLRGGGLSTFPAWRRVVAILTNAGLTVVTVFAALWASDAISGLDPAKAPTNNLGAVLSALGRIWLYGPSAIPSADIGIGILTAAAVWLGALDAVKSVLGRLSSPLRRAWTALQTGLGGSARFLGYVDEWSMRWRPGRLLMGVSVYDGKKLGRKDDRHAIVIATTRSGKGRSFIIPNLLTYPGSAFVIDPKGENAAVTARIRKRKLGQTVHILDPFGVLDRMKLAPFWWRGLGQGGESYRSARYNPLVDIDLNAVDAVEQIQNLGAALVTVHPGANPFWDHASQIILAGVVAHVLTSDQVNDADRHLGTVRDYVAGINGRDMRELDLPVPAGRPVLGHLAAAAGQQMREASSTAGSDILTTLRVHIRWLNSEAIRANLSASDVSLRGLKHGNASVYLVIPPEYLETHSCYLRVMVTMGLREAGKGAKPRHPMLYLLDEFASLGKLDVCATAAAVTTGSGLMLCPIVQNTTQLKIYGDKWEVFLANAGQQQIFAANDSSTAEYFTQRLGKHMTWQCRNGEWSPYMVTELRTSGELMRETSRSSKQALVSFEGSEAMMVRRANYDTLFGAYDPNPYEMGSLKAKNRHFMLTATDAGRMLARRVMLRLLGKSPPNLAQ